MSEFNNGSFLIRRPKQCREEGCGRVPTWIAIYVKAPLPEAFDHRQKIEVDLEAACGEHVDREWKEGRVKGDIEKLLFVVGLGDPRTCTLRHDGMPCGNPEELVTLYIVESPELFRLGPTCSNCIAEQDIELDHGEVLIYPPVRRISLDELQVQFRAEEDGKYGLH